MYPHLVFVIVGLLLPFASANYGSASYGSANYGPANYGPGAAYGGQALGSAAGVEEFISAAGHQQGAASLTAAGDVSAAPSAQAGLAQANAQLQALNASPGFQSIKNSDSIAESLAESSLAANARQGNLNLVAPNVVGQTAFSSLLVPNGLNNHQVSATQPLQPIVVNQPGSPPAQISSGPPAVVRAAPVVYKLKPSIIYQQEVINKVPTPLSLNPVYVKVYKPGKHHEAPIAVPAYGSASYGGSSSGSVSGASQYASAAQYAPSAY